MPSSEDKNIINLKKTVGHILWVYSWILYPPPLIWVAVPTDITQGDYCSCTISLEIENIDFSHFILLFKIVFSCFSSFAIPNKFYNNLVYIGKKLPRH